jgi:hypothetical protein
MPLDAISATLLTTAALMFVALIRRVKAGLWPRARREIRRRWVAKIRSGDNWATQRLPAAHREAHALVRQASPTAVLQTRVSTLQALKLPAGQVVDLLVTDPRSRRRMAVLIEPAAPSESRRRRMDLTRETLLSQGLAVSIWRHSAMPSPAAVRRQLRQAGIAVATAAPVSGPQRRPGFDGQTQPSTLY